jgi:hypothetical protein
MVRRLFRRIERLETQLYTESLADVCKGPYAPPSPAPAAGALEGGIRLLMCERPSMTAGMSISRESFELIESAFHLCPATLPSFFITPGVCSRHTTLDPQTGTVSRLALVVKAT